MAAKARPRYRRILLKLSGEALLGKGEWGIDHDVLNGICRQVLEAKELGVEIALVIGGGNIMLIEVNAVDTVYARIAPLVKVVMSLRTQGFGMREFAIQDPDGYVITFAERVAKPPREV